MSENNDVDTQDNADAGGALAQVVFTPSGKRGRFPIGSSVLDAARALGVDLDSVCGGRGICGRCQVVQSLGDFPKFNIKSVEEHLSAFGKVETRYKDKRGMKDDRRLGCHATIQGDLVIDIPEESQVHRQVVRKRAEARDIKVNPMVRLHYVEVEEPDMHKPTGDLERIKIALLEQWKLSITDVDLQVLQTLQPILRKSDWKITVAVRDETHIVAIWSGLKDRIFGMAVDVGSTTMSAHLTDMQTGEVVTSVGAMNPQIRFGEDLMSRVSYSMMNPGGDKEMTAVVRETLSFLALQAASEAFVDPSDILELTLVGNPVMHHLFLGINPVELGWAPFALSTNGALTIKATDLDLKVNEGARAYLLPCIAGHVGADAAAVLLSENPQQLDEVSLIVDVGTNAEIALGNKDGLLACSSPTGPALEGAQISSGQRAAPGAIERVRIDPETLEPRFRVIGSDLWSDDDGFAAAVKKSGVSGICGSGIIEVLAEMYLAGIISTDGIIDGAMAAKNDRIVPEGRTFSYIVHRGEPEIRVTQGDIRAIQLAKGALYAGAQILVDRLGKEPDRVVLAGAFGSHIDAKYAMILGLIPDCNLDKVASVGNAAGTGARIALLNKDARQEIEELVMQVEKIETAVEQSFQQHFVEAMAIPHDTAPFVRLREAVPMPPTKKLANSSEGEEGGRRRRRKRG